MFEGEIPFRMSFAKPLSGIDRCKRYEFETNVAEKKPKSNRRQDITPVLIFKFQIEEKNSACSLIMNRIGILLICWLMMKPEDPYVISKTRLGTVLIFVNRSAIHE